MSAKELQSQLEHLRSQLAEQSTLSDTDREELLRLSHQIEEQLSHEEPAFSEGNLVDGVNLAIERFTIEHPTLSVTLRSILQSLANIGI